jgi:hypothetical protein
MCIQPACVELILCILCPSDSTWVSERHTDGEIPCDVTDVGKSIAMSHCTGPSFCSTNIVCCFLPLLHHACCGQERNLHEYNNWADRMCKLIVEVSVDYSWRTTQIPTNKRLLRILLHTSASDGMKLNWMSALSVDWQVTSFGIMLSCDRLLP